MINEIDVRGRKLTAAELKRLIPRAQVDIGAAVDVVHPVLESVRKRGRVAVQEYTQKFDGVQIETLRVSAQQLQVAAQELDPQVRSALEESIRRARKVAASQRNTDHITELEPGATVADRWVPVRRVGLYVPGGLAVYPSSVVMNVVPAQIAGVASLVLVSPPQKEFNGLPHPTILAAAHLLGVQEVWAMGGAQAVGALAYGFEDGEVLEPVDVITGPGNVYVAAAKRSVRSLVGIDAEAGPTEVAVIADETANPDIVAADLVSQAEHDPHAAAVLITDSQELAQAVQRRVQERARVTKHSERVVQALTGQQSAVVITDDLDQAIAVADAFAAEHLEIQTTNAAEVAARITNAGAIFVGEFSPVSLGDYSAGSNHVLPTSGTAAYASGLSVHAFMKRIEVIDYNRSALQKVSDGIETLAVAEDLPAHGEAVKARFS